MKPPPFTYHRPGSVGEALASLAGLAGEPGGAKVLAGGQSLVPLLSMRLAAPAHLVDVNRLPGLDTVEVGAQEVRVGALVRHAALEQHADARAAVPLLGEALRLVAHPTIRNRGTTVGSIVHADPAAEMPAVLAVLGGTVELASTAGTREVAGDAFVVGPMETVARPDELVVAVRFRRPPPRTGTAFLEVSRRHGDYALAGVAALVTVDDDGTVTTARAALVGVGPRAAAVDLRDGVTAGRLDDAAVTAVVDAAIGPDDDIHASASYRRHLAAVLTRRAVLRALERTSTATEAAA